MAKVTNFLEPSSIPDRRNFYVNDKLEFSIFFDKTVTDRDVIMTNLYNWKDWIFMVKYCNWQVKKVIWKDDYNVYLTTKETNEPDRK